MRRKEKRGPTRGELLEWLQKIGGQMSTCNDVEDMEALVMDALDWVQLLAEDHELTRNSLRIVK